MKTVSVVGLGYIGLPTAAFFADADLEVLGVDINSSFVDSINAAEVPFSEPGFDELLRKVVEAGKLRASTKVEPADVFILAVPTPFGEHHRVDDRFIMAAAESVSSSLEGGELLVLESTSPPGTTRKMAEYVIELRPDLTLEPGRANSLYIAHCPERVIPGRVMVEMSANDRIVGGINQESTRRASTLYAEFCHGEILETTLETAELAKLTENSFRDVNIAFANELSILCDQIGVDVWELIDLANHHPRVDILNPGPGVGGHCIAVDPWFIVSSFPEDAKLIRTAREVNDTKPLRVVEKILAAARTDCSVGILGLAFKADIDDLRESPSINIVEALASDDRVKKLYTNEPNVDKLPASLANNPKVELQSLAYIQQECDVVALLVDHKEYRGLSFEDFNCEVIDTRGLLNRSSYGKRA